MTLEKYFKQLTDFVNEHPEAMQLEVIHSSDDEGNQYTPVVYDPGTLMRKEGRREYTTEFQLEQEADAVCIN